MQPDFLSHAVAALAATCFIADALLIIGLMNLTL
jgi:hypothetical protein